MRCPACKKEIKGFKEICVYCGHSLVILPKQKPASPPAPTPNDAVPPQSVSHESEEETSAKDDAISFVSPAEDLRANSETRSRDDMVSITP